MPAAHRFDLDAIGAGLPVAEARAQLERAVDTGVAVVTAPPGSGKTTLLPALVASRTRGLTVVTQPRRIAVRAAARRLASLDGSALGGPVGFTVRGERHVGPETRVEMLTPGVLLRRLLVDPSLEGIGAVLLDEVHERSLETDLLLGMLAEARMLREDLTVVAMSATLDAAAVAQVLGGAEVVDVPGALHPLQIDHAPASGPRLDERGVSETFLEHLARTTVVALDDGDVDADALVFVPGAREVDRTVALLRDLAPQREVLPLHGRLPAAQQDRATGGRPPGAPPRIIVSTAVAESSLTVPGVRLVVDAGLSRQVRRDRGRDMPGLVTVSASRAEADQRAGRAARLGPGRAIRAYAEAEAAAMPAQSPPEITTADLTDAALQLACWGAPRGEDLPLLTPPPSAEIRAAEATLRALDLVDAAGRPTASGRDLATWPVGVREARALHDGTARLPGPEAGRVAAEVVAAISDDHRVDGGDLPGLLAALRRGDAPGVERWRRERDRLERLGQQAAPGPEGTAPPPLTGATTPGERVGVVLALARPERIARRVSPTSRTYLLASGTRAALPEGSPLLGAPWLAVWEVQRAQGRQADGTGAVIRLAAPLAPADALAAGEPLLTEGRVARLDGGAVRVRERRALGTIELNSTPVSARQSDIAEAVLTEVRDRGVAVLPWTETATTLRRRLALLHRELGAPWPAVDDEALRESVELWLAPQLASLRSADLSGLDLVRGLRLLLPWPEASRLEDLVPERLPLPSGGSARVEYPPVPQTPRTSRTDPPSGEAASAPEPPVLAAKLQELFGLATTPRLVDDRVPVLLHLLSPARRPLAITDDLSSFWNGPYQEVRREMRGRYPKHPWPEDPWTAPATARTTRHATPRTGGPC
ncbi:ATP-dependent helicase HrpB [Brachybacterium sp. EF45031]|uniref:ATP-dependent helicase HrpB n=1 Tax=Brachybacterium sillae TaxID=2810536 RepID=UPI00217F2201|nr:ATP-dependent helicase HrpB [Brachybacterium sillae]MCS6711721.1 ATP-dependent helicase HrpB [Brachybacterium sillae]